MELSFTQLPPEIRLDIEHKIANLGSFACACRSFGDDVRSPYFVRQFLFKPFIQVLRVTFSLSEREIAVVLGREVDLDDSNALIGKINEMSRVLKEQRSSLPVQDPLTLARLDEFARRLHQNYAAYQGDFEGKLFERLISALSLRNFIGSSLILATPKVINLKDEQLWEVVNTAILQGATKVVKDLSAFLNLDRMDRPQDPLVAKFLNAYCHTVTVDDVDTLKAILNMAFTFKEVDLIFLFLVYALKHGHKDIVKALLECEDYRKSVGDLEETKWMGKINRTVAKQVLEYAAEKGLDQIVKICLTIDWSNAELVAILKTSKQTAAETILASKQALKLTQYEINGLFISYMFHWRQDIVKALLNSEHAYKISIKDLSCLQAACEYRGEDELASAITAQIAENSTWTNIFKRWWYP